ncbi:MAG: SdpI family protein [Bifidobacteriaceae bacterium]|jgi:uncharacterized membrane protein|nr:SdpI family protein [Bifidobacteriaceae bacterium]
MTAVYLALLLSLVSGSVALAVVARAALKGRLPRNSFAGIRTRATLADDSAWERANRQSAPSMMLMAAVLFAESCVVAVSWALDAPIGLVAVTAGIAGLVTLGVAIWQVTKSHRSNG